MLLKPMLPIIPCTTDELEFSKSLLQSMQCTMTSTVHTFSVGINHSYSNTAYTAVLSNSIIGDVLQFTQP